MKPVARPKPGDLFILFGIPGALYLFDRVTHQDVLTAVLTIVFLGSCIGWAFWPRREPLER